jgi:hypothetical protein
MLRFEEMAFLSDEALAGLDVAEMHLACAAGIPGAEAIDVGACLAKLDWLAALVRQRTEGHLASHKPPEGSEARVRMDCLALVLWKVAGIRYNPDKIAEDAPWDLEDTFIHGALFSKGGTCATLPIVYAAVGRRLGYPLKLVSAWGPKASHLFCRWDGGGERFNFEVNYTGVSFHDDAHYRTGSPEERLGCFLTSMTPRQELGHFLVQRAFCFEQNGMQQATTDAFAWAYGVCPENALLRDTLAASYNRWLRMVKRRQPSGFPQVMLQVRQRRYPDGLPRRMEQEIVCLTTLEKLLDDPRWQGLWQQTPGEGIPKAVLVDSLRHRVDCAFQY